MAGRHLRDMISAYGERDDLKFRRAAQAIIQEEEAKRHNVLARELRGILAANSALAVTEEPALPEVPVDRDSSLPLAYTSRPDAMLTDLVLGDQPATSLKALLNEVRQWSRLDKMGLPRRNRLLLSGPPGCGKTSTVEALAGELGRPLVTARVEGLISSYLGETAANLNNLFEFASSGPYVLFLDEFDSLGKRRDDPSDHGELRRVVNAVLQQIDRYAGPSLIVAATNHSGVLDSALWRRFDTIVELPLPTATEITELLSRLLPELPFDEIRGLANELNGRPHAAVEYFAYWVRRSAALDDASTPDPVHLHRALSETLSRPWM
ncbi:AAA family ATPase [Microbacterium sp. SL62]|uniref:AAA family ATPase n=1 Tax=Microbacterium sp. SL62 TaxID=2995139 RepID=UPI00227492B8|nr:AAA family ATPase [Microbacterium sp. SL62]MCY1715851.1 AAA family ATPase [Microbacterium sp. SL62]